MVFVRNRLAMCCSSTISLESLSTLTFGLPYTQLYAQARQMEFVQTWNWVLKLTQSTNILTFICFYSVRLCLGTFECFYSYNLSKCMCGAPS